LVFFVSFILNSLEILQIKKKKKKKEADGQLDITRYECCTNPNPLLNE